MKIALAQLNPIVGDLVGNSEQICLAAEKAAQDGADLLVTSELVISGYPPKDLLLREGFVNACDRQLDELSRRIPHHLGLLVGHPTYLGTDGSRAANAASLLFQGRVVATVHKTLLPNYDVFDERRYFHPSRAVHPIEFQGRRIGVHICEDAWWGEPDTFYHDEPDFWPDPVLQLVEQGSELLINLSASPFEIEKPNRRRHILSRHTQKHKLPIVFVNQVGGNDDLVFDGHSFVMNSFGQIVAEAGGFQEQQILVDLDQLPPECPLASPPREQLLLDALTLGLKDYLRKCGFSGTVLGLSGGIDSALACCIAARAIGPQNVHALLMPSRYSSEHSLSDAMLLAERLGVDAEIIPINEVHKAYESLPILENDLGSEPAGIADQNLQARIRGAIVMTRSNRHGWMALATGNKSELAVGYCTLYGDMCGGFAVLSDLLKRDIYGVSRFINASADREIIPAHIIEKAPSAELAPDQFDQDTLPPYPILDEILSALIEQEKSPASLYEKFPKETVHWVIKALDRNEFKRRQMPPGIKLSPRAFGSGRRMPMAARIHYE